MTHLASTAPLSSLATEALALRLARDAERFRAANDDGTLLAAALTEALSALPPPLCEKLIPCLDWHCTLALRELLSSGAVQLPELSDDDLVARHFAYAQAEEEERARLMLRGDSPLSPAAAAAVDARLLVDVHARPELFVLEPPVGHLVLPKTKTQPPRLARRAFRRVFEEVDDDDDAGDDKTPKPGSPSVVSIWQFRKNWRIFTMGQLDGLDWTGVVAAGGGVLACATTQPPKHPRYGDKLVVHHLLRYSPPTAFAQLRFDGESYATFLALHSPDSPTTSSDIDLYLYGMSDAELRVKQRAIAEVLVRNARRRGSEVYATRTPAAVTVFSAFPYRSVQIIVGAKAQCAAEVILDFDLDCCALIYDGDRLHALPRAMLALNRRCNVLRADKNSFAKVATSRLLKYGDRGFATAITERFFIKPVIGDALGGTLDDARAVKLLRFAKVWLLALDVGDSPDSIDWLTGDVVPTRSNRKALHRRMKPQDDIYAAAGEFCVAELMKRVLNLQGSTFSCDADVEEDHRAFDVQITEHQRQRNDDAGGEADDEMHTGLLYSQKCVPYGAPVEEEGDSAIWRSPAFLVRGCPTSIQALGGVPATTAQTAEIIAAAQRWAVAKTDDEVLDMAQSASVAARMFNDVSPGVGCHAYTCAPQVDEARLVVDASATSVLRSGNGAVSFALPNIAGCDWRLELSTKKNLIAPQPDPEKNPYNCDALMLALTMVRVVDVNPMLDTYQTSLWPPLEQCAAEERVRHAYKLLLANIVLEIENPDNAKRKLQLDDTYAFNFVRYAADGVNTHINGADVLVPPIAAPLDVMEDEGSVDSSATVAMEEHDANDDLIPSRTWRNYIYWQFITPHPTAAAALLGRPPWAPTLVDAEGKLRLRLRLQTTRIERKRDITPFPEAQ